MKNIPSPRFPKSQSGNSRRIRRRRDFLAGLACVVVLVLAATRAPAGPAAEVSMEPAFKLTPGAANEPVPLRWAGGWILAKVMINGADAGWFKIATGWVSSSIDPQVAARLKLPIVPECGLMEGFIADAKGLKSKSYRVDGLQCGEASAKDVYLAPFDLTEMSQESIKMYGEGISGILGWDLLKTLPFVLDEPGLQLEWQREATPAEGATRVPVIEKYGRPFIEITAGKDCKVMSMFNSASQSMPIRMSFLRQHADQLWTGPVIAHKSEFFSHAPDEGLPLRKIMESFPTSRWLEVECGGLKQMLPAVIDPRNEPESGEVELGTGWLRRMRVLVDGPGKALWVTPATSVPEVELIRKGRPEPSPYLMVSALWSAIHNNDPAAIRALVAGGADAKGPPTRIPLAEACAGGSREAAHALLAAGAPAEPDPQVSGTPLVAACKSGDPVLIKMLLDKGADPNRATRSGFTPLMAAVRSGGPAAVRALRGKARFPSDAGGAAQLLAEACGGGNLSVAKEMLAANPASAQSQVPWPKLLELALLGGDEELVAWVMQQGGPKVASLRADIQPLLAAILPTRPAKSAAIRERLVTKLLAAGADPNASRNGLTPLLLAARYGNGAMVTALLAAGAKATAKDYKMRNALLQAAVANQPLEVITPLLSAGIDLNGEDSNTELTVLATYAMHGNLDACAALLAAGADPNARSTFGPSPLLSVTNGLHSTDEEALAVFNLLLKQGAQPDAFSVMPSELGLLFGAIAADRGTLIKPLVDAGAKPNEEMYSKVTPLSLAAAVSSAATVQALLDAGADPKTLDVKGISPLAHAAAAGRTANMALLLAHGSSPDAATPQAIPPLVLAAATGQLRAVRALLAAGADNAAIHPETKKTALETAESRGDQSMVKLLENASLNK